MNGLLAEFDTPKEILEAAHAVAKKGYSGVDAFTPFPVEGLSEVFGFHKTPISSLVLCFGLIGAVTGYLLQYYCNGINYPLNIGGRPLNSIPAFIPITFELAVLFASFAAVFGLFFLNGMPKLWRPVFEVEGFERSTLDGFFLYIEQRDPETRHFLESLKPHGVYEIFL
jgi:hypothetical protein